MVLLLLLRSLVCMHRHLLYDKEQQEYAHWLEGVNSFVKSS